MFDNPDVTRQLIDDRHDRWQREAAAHRVTGRTIKPFAAAYAPSVFAERGYAIARGDMKEFFAPDEDVLLDEKFGDVFLVHVSLHLRA